MFSNRIISRLAMSDYGSAYARIPMAKVALNMIIHNPVIGVGLNNYTEVMYQYGLGKLLPGQTCGVHNAFLFMCAEIGIIGLIIFLYLWFIAYKRLLFCYKNSSAYIWKTSASLLCGFTALFIHANVEQSFYYHVQLNAMLWSFFGLAAAIKVITINRQLSNDQKG